MAKLFIGCQVRVVHSLCGNKGRTGRITAVEYNTFIDGYGCVDAAYRCDKSDGDYGWGPAYCYEPIQPSGHRAGDYSLGELLDRCRADEGVAA